MIRPALLSVVEVSHVQVAPADNIVIAEYHACNGRQENRVGGEIRSELVRRRNKVPLQSISKDEKKKEKQYAPDTLPNQLLHICTRPVES